VVEAFLRVMRDKNILDKVALSVKNMQ